MRAKKKTKPTFVVLFALLICAPVTVGSAYADTQYVTDMLILCLRAGPGNEYKVIRNLRSDTPVEVLEEEQGYLKVRTEEGEEGWVLKQYISSDTPKPVIIEALKRDVKQLRETVEKLENERSSNMNELETSKQGYARRVKEVEREFEEKSKEISWTTGELKRITDKYNILVYESKNVVELAEQRDTLRTANNRLNKEVERLGEENTRLGRTRMQRWFLAGAGVFFIGLIFGSLSKKKRYY